MQRKRKWPKKKISPFLKRMNQMFSCLVAGARGRCDVLRASLRKAIYIYIYILNNHDVVIFNVKVPFNAATFTQMSSAQGWFFLCGGEWLVWLLCSWLIYCFHTRCLFSLDELTDFHFAWSGFAQSTCQVNHSLRCEGCHTWLHIHFPCVIDTGASQQSSVTFIAFLVFPAFFLGPTKLNK